MKNAKIVLLKSVKSLILMNTLSKTKIKTIIFNQLLISFNYLIKMGKLNFLINCLDLKGREKVVQLIMLSLIEQVVRLNPNPPLNRMKTIQIIMLTKSLQQVQISLMRKIASNLFLERELKSILLKIMNSKSLCRRLPLQLWKDRKTSNRLGLIRFRLIKLFK